MLKDQEVSWNLHCQNNEAILRFKRFCDLARNHFYFKNAFCHIHNASKSLVDSRILTILVSKKEQLRTIKIRMSENQYDSTILSDLDHWSQLSIDDLTIHIFFQKSEKTVELVEKYLSELDKREINQELIDEVFHKSVILRDFTILLRDSLLSLVKFQQYNEDNRKTDPTFKLKLNEVIKSASLKVIDEFKSKKVDSESIEAYKHQNSPVSAILDQIAELNIQLKKIYRSHDKINEIRLNVDSFKREFHVQFQKQIHAVDELVDHIGSIQEQVNNLYPKGTKGEIQKLEEQLSLAFNKLELMKSMETMELMSYSEKNSLNIPIDVINNSLESKTFEIQTEMSKWFSANIYPHIIDLENRRNLAIERSLTAISKSRIKLSALLLENEESYDVSKSRIKPVLSSLMNDYIKPLIEEKSEGNEKVQRHFEEELFASAIYDKVDLFLPNNGGVQINNISRDAQKRMSTQIKKSRKSVYSWLRNSLARYVELDRTPFNAFVSNKLLVNKDDDRLSLFLKKGYLGKSFMVNRQEVMDAILNDHKHWKDGYSAAILIHGNTGSGKSAVLGMLSQLSLEEEVITVNPGEPYFTNNRSFDGSYDIRSVVETITYQNIGKKIILAIDDLGLWHSKSHHLFDNISDLFDLVKKYRGDVYFVISANSFLKDRLLTFKDLDFYFSSVLEIGEVSNNNIKEALDLRIKALPELGLSASQNENKLRPIIQNAKKNMGHAMLEYCRFYDDAYVSSLKSQNFSELISENATLLKYISCFRQLKVSQMSRILNEIDLRDLEDKIDYLVGQKILVYTKSNVIAINPFLVYSIENVLNKLP